MSALVSSAVKRIGAIVSLLYLVLDCIFARVLPVQTVNLRDLSGRQIIITGVSEGGIGYEVAFPEVPFDKRVTHEVEPLDVLERRSTRALRLAASVGDGLLVPMGFEFGCRDRFDPTRGDGSGLKGLQERGIVGK